MKLGQISKDPGPLRTSLGQLGDGLVPEGENVHTGLRIGCPRPLLATAAVDPAEEIRGEIPGSLVVSGPQTHEGRIEQKLCSRSRPDCR